MHVGRSECIGLRNGAGKTVKQKTVGAIGLFNAFANQVNNDFIWNETAGFHYFFCHYAQFGACFYSIAQYIAGRNLGN